MINWFKKDDAGLEFICHPSLYGVAPEPQLASKHIPEWFKKIKTHTKDRQSYGGHAHTAKKCLPMLDAMSLGYTIRLPYDVYVITNHDLSIIEAKALDTNSNAQVTQHSHQQFYTTSFPGFKQNAIKWENVWRIKTNPGWSCYFTSPINHMNPAFECLSGVVDTDKYNGIINFPCIWKQTNFDGMIRAGTPLVTVIPFKRKTFKNKAPVVRAANEAEIKENEVNNKIQHLRHHYYTQELRENR